MDRYEKNQIDFLISRYLMGNASSHEIEELYNWIMQSDENRQYFHQQQDIWAILNPTIDIKDVNTAIAEQKILKKTEIMPGHRSIARRLIVFWSRIAAVAILPLIAIIVYLMSRPIEDSHLDDVTITTAFGSLSNTNLPDGTTVWLNANSSLTYNPDMSGATRNILLQGEAYFEVKADAQHPFNVRTPFMTVTATGTEFNVNAYDSIASVTLVNGRVNVGVKNRSLPLSPGEHLAITDGRPVISNHIDTEKYCSWRNGMLIFEDESLQTICNRLQQMYDVEFHIVPELKDRTFRMILNGENISEIVHFFEMAAPVVCEFETSKSPSDTTRKKQHIHIMPL